jgi:hypothetical protein
MQFSQIFALLSIAGIAVAAPTFGSTGNVECNQSNVNACCNQANTNSAGGGDLFGIPIVGALAGAFQCMPVPVGPC